MKQMLLKGFIISSAVLSLSISASANVYDVNSLGSTNSGTALSGTLLYCITQANSSAGPHNINFSVAGTISISSSAYLLPALNQSITIDGSTAPGYAGVPVIILDGTGLGNGDGLEITASNCAVYGIEIVNFPYRGLYLNGSSANNFTIGASGKGNVIRGNGYYGISLDGAHNGIIAYNKVGTDASGSVCQGNGYDGIDLYNASDNNQILNNHVSCNGYNGIQIGGSSNNVVKGNIIGPLANSCQGNLYRGIDIEDGSQNNIVGGTSPSEFNKIAGNEYWGVEVKNNSPGNILSGNSYLCNAYGAINLDNNGNNNMSFPVITGANTNTVTGTADPDAIVEVFKSQYTNITQCPGTPNNQGADFLGSTTADAGGTWTLTGVFGGYLVATARDANGNTSEFGSNTNTGVSDTLVNACSGSILSVAAAFNSSATGICEKACIDFVDQSQNASTWHWYFQGGSPAYSFDQNPTSICYNDAGVYPVTLVVYDGSGVDSSVAVLYITVYPTPPTPVVSVNGDTLVSTPAVNYQWYFNSVIISGATDQDYVASQSGFYYVQITDSAGCTSISLTSYVDLTGLENVNAPLMDLNIDGAGNANLIIYGMEGATAKIVFYDLYGRSLMSKELQVNSSIFDSTFHFNDVPAGVYLVCVTVEDRMLVRKAILRH